MFTCGGLSLGTDPPEDLDAIWSPGSGLLIVFTHIGSAPVSTISGYGVPGNIDVMRLLLCYSILLKILTGRASCCSGEIDLVVMSFHL